MTYLLRLVTCLFVLLSFNAFAVDTDGDGVDDVNDNCPNIPNLECTFANGQYTCTMPDSDGDGIGDACDDIGSLIEDFISDDSIAFTSGGGSPVRLIGDDIFTSPGCPLNHIWSNSAYGCKSQGFLMRRTPSMKGNIFNKEKIRTENVSFNSFPEIGQHPYCLNKFTSENKLVIAWDDDFLVFNRGSNNTFSEYTKISGLECSSNNSIAFSPIDDGYISANTSAINIYSGGFFTLPLDVNTFYQDKPSGLAIEGEIAIVHAKIVDENNQWNIIKSLIYIFEKNGTSWLKTSEIITDGVSRLKNAEIIVYDLYNSGGFKTYKKNGNNWSLDQIVEINNGQDHQGDYLYDNNFLISGSGNTLIIPGSNNAGVSLGDIYIKNEHGEWQFLRTADYPDDHPRNAPYDPNEIYALSDNFFIGGYQSLANQNGNKAYIYGFTDDDEDGVSNMRDNCLNLQNSDQADLDNDGIGDACDTNKDGDAWEDSFELAVGADPLNPSDNDIITSYLVDQANNSQALLDRYTDTDEDGISDALEIVLGGDPNDANDSGLLNQIKDYVVDSIGKSVPAMSGIGLLALGLSMLGLGAVRLRKK